MAEPVPAVVVYARGFGRLHWMCPACTYIHGSRGLSYRSARLACGGKLYRHSTACHRTFRLGFSFTKGIDLAAPFNAIYTPGLDGFTTNRLGRPGGSPAIARFIGSLEFRCPACDTQQRQQIEPLGTVTCTAEACRTVWNVGVIFHRPTAKTKRLKTPHDWVFPDAAPVPVPA